MRVDLHVPNESDGFVFTSATQRGRGLSPGDAGWTEAVERGDLLPLFVESEDSATVRVVIGSLQPDELDQWVGVVRAGLRVPDGRLVLAGGIEVVLEDADRGTSVELAVPAGAYRATVYCYASSPNGLWCLRAAGDDEALGAWFRRKQPGAPMPAWLHDLCVHDPELDPGHQREWKRATWRGGVPVVDFLLHLEPGESARARIAEHGFLEPSECRKTAAFPLGVPAVGLPAAPAGPPPPPDPEPPPPSPGTPPALSGGPVTLPATKLVRLARLAWFCHPYTLPALRMAFPSSVPALEDVDGARLRRKGRELTVVLDDTGQAFGAQDALVALGKQLATVPDGTTIELDLARKAGGPLGRHRYRAVAESGAWRLTHAEPAVDAARIAEALALVESFENGRKLVARDEDEAARIEARVTKSLADHFGANTLQRAGTEVALKRRDPTLFAHVLARVFWMRYAGTWPMQDEDAN